MNTNRFSENRHSDLDRTEADILSQLDREAEKSDHQNDVAACDAPGVCSACGYPARHCCCLLRDLGAD